MLLYTYIFAFLFAILTLVLIHECGHFLVARLFKVKVERFSIGFGKPFYTWKNKKSGTQYAIAPILLGGYVKLLDTRETKTIASNNHLAFDHKPILQRIAIIIAGPMANIIFALFAFWLMFVIGFELPKPIIGKIVHNSIANQAAMHSGEEIIKTGQINTQNWEEILIAMLARIGNTGNLKLTTKSSHLQKIKTYQLDLTNWGIDTYESDPLLNFGIIRYTPPIPTIINNIKKDSPASKVGLQKNDRIIAVNDKSVNDWKDLIELVKKYPEKQIKLSVERNKKVINLTITTGWKFGPGWKKIGFLGIEPSPAVWPKQMLREYKYSPWPALEKSWHKIKLFTGFNGIILNKLIMGKLPFNILGGPVAIFAASGQALCQGFIVFLSFLAIISLSIALINLLPLPGLDGGYIALLLVEAITRRPISMRVQTLILRLGMAFFIVLILHTTINDLQRIFG
jgi:regulator of sigma E protease